MGVLPVQVDQAASDFGKGRCRGRPTVDVRLRAPIGGNDPRQYVLFIVEHEAAIDGGLIGPGSHQRRVGAATDQQVDGVHQKRLSRTGFSGEGDHAGWDLQRELVDHAQVGDCDLYKHSLSTSLNFSLRMV